MKKILVIGGHGFMGKNIQETFKKSEHKIHYLSRRNGLDITNEDSLLLKLKEINPDIIIHAAAHVGSINYVNDNAANVVNDNTEMYLNLYRCVLKHNKDIIIINPISNCSYPGYIDVQNEDKWWDGKIHESVESYGMPKKMGFIISECYKKQYGIKTINLIVPNAYGPNDYLDEQRTHAMNGIIMRMIKSMKNGDKEFVVWGTGTPIREWVYMPDMGKVLRYIIDGSMYNLPNPINIGKECGISIMDSVSTVKRLLNYDVKIVTDITKQDGAPIKVLGNGIFKENFPNFKFTEYEEGIKDTINYYKKELL